MRQGDDGGWRRCDDWKGQALKVPCPRPLAVDVGAHNCVDGAVGGWSEERRASDVAELWLASGSSQHASFIRRVEESLSLEIFTEAVPITVHACDQVMAR